MLVVSFSFFVLLVLVLLHQGLRFLFEVSGPSTSRMQPLKAFSDKPDLSH